MQKIRKDDKVLVIAGKDKGRRGKVIKLIKVKSSNQEYLLVEGVNMVKKHVKADPQQDKPGSIVSKEAKIHISNVALVNPKTDKADKVGFKIVNGKKVRIFKSNDEVVDV